MDLREGKVRITNLDESVLEAFWELAYGPEANLEWMNWNGPYFQDPVLTWEEFQKEFDEETWKNPRLGIIWYEQKLVGFASAHWEDGRLKQWLDFGVIIYDLNFWGKGIGTEAMKIWISYLFECYPYLPHIGFTTWSGNKGMMKIGEKLGMKKEAQIRKVRYWQGSYYDSVKYGLLREEWAADSQFSKTHLI